MLLRKRTAQRYAAAGLVLLMAVSARAQDLAVTPPAKSQHEIDQLIYKGVVGNVLETVPLDPQKRVNLQRGNAVISNTLSGRSLAVLLGVTNPVFLIGGLAWGLFAASRIKPATRTPVVLTSTPAPTAAAHFCRVEWSAIAEVAAPVAPDSLPIPPRDEVAAVQP